MSQLSGFLKLEVSKYKDIDHILKKLEDDGEVQNIYDVFKGVFDNEFKFTFQELLRIQDAKKEPLNIKRQCENNLSLFKNNLMLIVDMIIEKSLKSTLSENKSKFGEAYEAPSFIDETTEAVSYQNTTISASPIPQKRQLDKEKAKPTTNNRNTESRSPDRTLNLSFDTTKNSINPHQKKLNASPFFASKIESPVSNILHGTSSPQRTKDNKMSSSFSHEKSSPQKTPGSARSNKQAQSSFNRSRVSINNTNSFVNSEFNYIQGSARFSRSPKSHETQNLNPGPGAYEERTSIGRSQSPKIGKAAKVCWFDDVAAKSESPGPYLYPSKHFLSK